MERGGGVCFKGGKKETTHHIAIFEPGELGGALVPVDGVVVGHDALAVDCGLLKGGEGGGVWLGRWYVSCMDRGKGDGGRGRCIVLHCTHLGRALRHGGGELLDRPRRAACL